MKNHLIINTFIVFIVIVINTTKATTLMNKIALVTGAARGLGKGYSEELLNRTAKVCLVDYNERNGQLTLKEFQKKYGRGNVVFYRADITSKKEMEGAFKYAKDKFGGLDIVINNAGVGGEAKHLWERTIDVNVEGTIRGTLLAIENLRKDKGGRGGVIVNVASMTGFIPNPCSPTYCASKSAIIQYSLSWMKNPSFKKYGIRLNVMAQSFVDTQLFENLANQDNCLLPELAIGVIKKVGVMTVKSVAVAMMDLVEPASNKSGEVMKLTMAYGKSYHPMV